jgi:ATP-dependent helicase/nuclease subunit B
MATIAIESLEAHRGDPWRRIVAQVGAWATAHRVTLRDAMVLLPFAQQLSPARRAWAAAGGWMPRIETTQTLARSLAPAIPGEPGQISFDPALDRLTVRRLLRSQSWIAGWVQRDARGFEHAVNAVMQTAHALARTAADVAPQERVSFWARGRDLLGVGGGPGAAERALARIALEWAAASPAPATDRLFALCPAAWIAVQAGGADRLALALMSGAAPSTRCLVIDADPRSEDALAAIAADAELTMAVCSDFEVEAQRTAALVLTYIDAGCTPVALVAQDRLLVRRVRALLSRHAVALQDETGWKLSTTRAAATVMSFLRAARPRAGGDDWLDWLKACAEAWPGTAGGIWLLHQVETVLRRHGWSGAASVDAKQLQPAAAAWWGQVQGLVHAFVAPGARPLVAWLESLRSALQGCGAWASLQRDEAGEQVIAALHLAAPRALAHTDRMELDEFAGWIDATLEDGSFLPRAPAQAEVIVTPLERAMLRPFGSVVMPGADERRLGGPGMPHPLLGDAVAHALGLRDAAARRKSELLAFSHLLRLPQVTLLRRLDDGGEPLAPSPLVERLALVIARAGGSIPAAPDPRLRQAVDLQPLPKPVPAAPDLLPARLSASACEMLRSCPYRFFALVLLGLREADELDDEVEKRDYGNWLHAVLDRFHRERAPGRTASDDEACLHEIARVLQEDHGLGDASFLPYAATFSRLVPRYVRWLHGRERQGARWSDGEREFTARPAEWGGVEMRGIIDRIDRMPTAEGECMELIDYKTGSAQGLREKLRQPQEDTQLAFYAALVTRQAQPPDRVSASYLPLDESEGIKALEHEEVEASAERLVEGLGRDLARLREGHALPPLGEGAACDFCAARGLCRRDHWSTDEVGA